MRTLCAVFAIALFAVTSAAADTPSTTSPDETTAQAQAELAQAQEELAAAQAELSTTLDAEVATAYASALSADTQKQIEEALAAAGKYDKLDMGSLMTEVQGACTLANGEIAALQPQLEELRKALAELKASGDLSESGAAKLDEVLGKLAEQKQLSFYKFDSTSPHMFVAPSAPQGFEWKPGPMSLWGEQGLGKLDLGQLEERLKALQLDTKALEESMKKLEELKSSGKLDELQKLYSQDFSNDFSKAYTLGTNTKMFGELQALPPMAQNLQVFHLGDNRDGKRVLVLRFNDDGTPEVTGTGFSEDELNQYREQLKAGQGVIKLRVPGSTNDAAKSEDEANETN